MITVDQPNLFSVAESFYDQSEQRRARYFAHGEEDFILVTAQPECDLEWLESLTDESILKIDETETLSLLEKREYRFSCGCSIEKIFPIIAGMDKVSLDDMFGGDETLAASCPRCGARYTVTREALEAFIKQ
jgi:molecular chaperone Hsp33